jgi:hypothetical protein
LSEDLWNKKRPYGCMAFSIVTSPTQESAKYVRLKLKSRNRFLSFILHIPGQTDTKFTSSYR